ncbi:Ig-like domain-containing protein [Methanopyrus kandleri]|uniref:Terpene cyclase/mutase family protein n=2 Tax=Methanopyrus kandleri TaxID=2320 RepID=Q8TZ06_METKA|nr:Ig-like domain-containing protein [Methanopyrus kandleri]AAM01352.1 Terpene cyclase/mutase family protein [Methanopyrus kandleri AV19]HII70725.1 Ig-like domain repeat protein [Methanopyrus kandleri]
MRQLLVILCCVTAIGPVSAATLEDADQCLKDSVVWLVENQFTEQDVGKTYTLRDPGGTYNGKQYEVHFATEQDGQLQDEGVASRDFTVEDVDVGTWPTTYKGDCRVIYVKKYNYFPSDYGLETVKLGDKIVALIDNSKCVIYVKKNDKYGYVGFGGEPGYSDTKFTVPMLVLAVEEGVTDEQFKNAVKRAIKWVLTVSSPRGYYYQYSLKDIRTTLEESGYIRTGSIGGVCLYQLIPLLVGRELGLVDDDLWNSVKDDAVYVIKNGILVPEVYCSSKQDKKDVLIVDSKNEIAYWVRQRLKDDTWVDYSAVYDTAGAVLTLIYAVKTGLISGDDDVDVGGSTYKVADIIKYAVNFLVERFYEGNGNPCFLEKQAVEQGLYWKSYYYPVKYAFYALWAIREAEKAGYLSDKAKDLLHDALRRYVCWLYGMQLEDKPGYFPYNEYIKGSPDFASTCAALLGLCTAVELGYEDDMAIQLMKNVVNALVSQYKEAKEKGLKYYFYVPTPQSYYYLYMSRFFEGREANQCAFATAHVVAALAAVEGLPESVRSEIFGHTVELKVEVPRETRVGTPVTIQIEVTIDGQPASSGEVRVYEGDRIIGVADVSDGKATITYTPEKRGEHRLKIEYRDPKYGVKSTTIVIKAKKKAPAVSPAVAALSVLALALRRRP